MKYLIIYGKFLIVEGILFLLIVGGYWRLKK